MHLFKMKLSHCTMAFFDVTIKGGSPKLLSYLSTYVDTWHLCQFPFLLQNDVIISTYDWGVEMPSEKNGLDFMGVT